ncbi:MAG: hypothetical protein MSIBF_01415 [Candidatus Altiarchaeales archaeon IMC4]|nr:MAG: hypothetical protein MSIBF_01415 [Candidatus Altiarchaeales archaeon IMC4]
METSKTIEYGGKFKVDIKKIDRKIEERKRIPAGEFIDRIEELLSLRSANEIKRITIRGL